MRTFLLGQQVLEALLPQADVFIQNLAPGAAERLGLDAASLLRKFPRIIACDVSGYGAGGPYSDKKAYDLLVQCEAGLVSITGTPAFYDGPQGIQRLAPLAQRLATDFPANPRFETRHAGQMAVRLLGDLIDRLVEFRGELGRQVGGHGGGFKPPAA